MAKYTNHSLSLTDEEEKKFQDVSRIHNVGIKKIFMSMVNVLHKEKPEDIVGGQPMAKEE